jgi:hypothetical protein
LGKHYYLLRQLLWSQVSGREGIRGNGRGIN